MKDRTFVCKKYIKNKCRIVLKSKLPTWVHLIEARRRGREWKKQHGADQQYEGMAVHRLFLDDNQRQSIIKEIQHIQFSCMTFLSVSYNTISSIEGVDRVSMPHLRNIQFGTLSVTSAHNRIIDVAAIRKASWRSLLSLTLCHHWIHFRQQLYSRSWATSRRELS